MSSRPSHPLRRTIRSLAVGFGVLVVIGGALAPLSASGSPGPRPHVIQVAKGVTLSTYIDRRFPIRVYVLMVDPSQGASIGTAFPGSGLGSLAPVSSLAKQAGAIAAINGDFGSNSHRPTHPFVSGGDLVQTSSVLGAMFSVSSDGSMRIGRPTQSVTVTEVDTGETWPIAEWNNGRPTIGELTAYTAAGGSLDKPRPFTCSARLLPSGPTSSTGNGDARAYTVDRSACASSSMAPNDGVVISGEPGTNEATFVRSLSAGESIQINWSIGWPGVTDAIGGSHLLVDHGNVVLGSCSGAICGRNPRTAIGLGADGRVMLVVVDGRQGSSVGLSLLELAQFMAGLGADSAMNLDGGGSSTMVVRGRVMNHPSDGFARSLVNAIVVRSPK